MKLNIIGAGTVGATLGKLFVSRGLLEVGGIYNQSLGSGEKAATRIGSGNAVEKIEQLPEADLWMLSTADVALSQIVESLKERDLSNSIIFHCSGALSSDVLKDLKSESIASIHPVKTFADYETAVKGFSGTYCTIEGHSAAIKVLTSLIEGIGAIPLEIPSDKKLLYHAAMVMISNYQATLLFSGIELLKRAGISEANALELISPIAKESLHNCLTLGPLRALTGPIHRGEVQIVAAELEKLAEVDSKVKDAYAALGQLTVKMALERGLSPKLAEDLKRILL